MEGYTGTHRSLTERMIGAATFNVGVYEEVEHDTGATGQAAIVVALVAIAAAIGASGGGVGAAVGQLVGAFVSWLVWAGITYLVGSTLFGGTATWGELLRTLGFAQSPGVLYMLGIIPVLGWVVRPIVWIWMLVLGIIAIRQALDFGTGRAVVTALIGWLALVVIGVAVAAVTGAAALIGGAMF